ncbi:unnamed protein product [Adineta steineri]|uniref:DUF4590 domain-containing protein n=3 Tax=Adineta steineri TaxID=433720 RepID=A0A813SF08_9BILA|nr:unnamed protein product [Adineta steineri]
MSTTKKSKKLTKNQIQAILNTDYIRQHLIQVGLIDNRGNIIHRDDDQHRSRQRYISNNKQNRLLSARYTTDASTPGRSLNTNESNSNRSSNYNSNDQLKQTNKSQNSARSPSSNKRPCVQNVLLRRTASPNIMPVGKRPVVTMMYFGPELNVEYDRKQFEPNGDEIVVMQQHCGGENLVVFKGFVNPNDMLSFESARHADYPFALTCYINGAIYNRLSVCCESRCKGFKRIGGKHGFFGIIDIQKEKSCRRCRFEQRMKKLIEEDEKKSPSRRQKSNTASRSRSKTATVRTKNSAAPNTPTKNSKPNTNRKSTSQSTTNSKATVRRSSDLDSIESEISNPKTIPKITTTRASDPEPTESDESSKKIIDYHTTKSTESGTTSSKPVSAQTSNPKSNTEDNSNKEPIALLKNAPPPTVNRTSSLESIESGPTSPEPRNTRAKNSARISNLRSAESDTTNPKLISIQTSNPKSNTEDNSNKEPIALLKNAPPPTVHRTSSLESIESGSRIPEPRNTHTTNSACIPTLRSAESDTTNPKPVSVQTSNPKSNAPDNSNKEPVVLRTSAPPPTVRRTSSLESIESGPKSPEPMNSRTTNSAQMSSPRSVESDISSPEPVVARKSNFRAPKARKQRPEITESDLSIPDVSSESESPTTFSSNHPPTSTSSSHPFSSSLEKPAEKDHRTILSRYNNKQNEASSSDTSEIRRNQHQKWSTSYERHNYKDDISSVEGSDDELKEMFSTTDRQSNLKYKDCTTTYSQSFINGVTPTTQCTAWITFAAGLTCTSYSSLRIYGSNDPTGLTISDPYVVTAIAVALRANTTYSATSNGYTWIVGVCGSGYEITATGTLCTCNSGYTIRPCIGGTANSGGIAGSTCPTGTQTLSLDFS